MDKPFEIIITTVLDGVGIAIVKRGGFGWKTSVAKPITLEWDELKEEGQTFAPTLIMNHIEAQYFLQAFKEALEPVGKKREREIKMKAKMDAMEEHLKDLRQIIQVLSEGAKRRITLGGE